MVMFSWTYYLESLSKLSRFEHLQHWSTVRVFLKLCPAVTKDATQPKAYWALAAIALELAQMLWQLQDWLTNWAFNLWTVLQVILIGIVERSWNVSWHSTFHFTLVSEFNDVNLSVFVLCWGTMVLLSMTGWAKVRLTHHNCCLK